LTHGWLRLKFPESPIIWATPLRRCPNAFVDQCRSHDRRIGVAAVVAIEPSFAGETSVAVPAPIVGAGIPALMAIGGSYWALRKRRKR
jgi:uncharacterized membrane protein